MLPRLSPETLVSPLYQAFSKQLLLNAFSGDINCSYGARLSVATDNSIYQQLPQLVLHPKDISDIQIITKLSIDGLSFQVFNKGKHIFELVFNCFIIFSINI